jgi:hypothetical protein
MVATPLDEPIGLNVIDIVCHLRFMYVTHCSPPIHLGVTWLPLGGHESSGARGAPRKRRQADPCVRNVVVGATDSDGATRVVRSRHRGGACLWAHAAHRHGTGRKGAHQAVPAAGGWRNSPEVSR